MAKSFTDLLDKYLDLRDQYEAEYAKGHLSSEWNDTYGFGVSDLLKKLNKAGQELNDFLEARLT